MSAEWDALQDARRTTEERIYEGSPHSVADFGYGFIAGAKWQSEQPSRSLTLADLEAAQPGTLVLSLTPDGDYPIVWWRSHEGDWGLYGESTRHGYYTSEQIFLGTKYGVLALIWAPPVADLTSD